MLKSHGCFDNMKEAYSKVERENKLSKTKWYSSKNPVLCYKKIVIFALCSCYFVKNGGGGGYPLPGF